MKNYEDEREEWKSEIELALAGFIRKVTAVLPVIAGAVAAGLLLQMAVSGPFEFTCKGVPQKRQWVPQMEDLNITEPQTSFPKMPSPMPEPMTSEPKPE